MAPSGDMNASAMLTREFEDAREAVQVVALSKRRARMTVFGISSTPCRVSCVPTLDSRYVRGAMLETDPAVR